MSIHTGHRKRLKDRFHNEGLTNFSEHEILELLLYYCVPRYDLNETAHRLVDRFGSLGNVIQTSEKELMKVEGVGENIARYLTLLNEAHRHILVTKAKEKKQLNSIREYGEYLRDFFSGMHHEVAYLLCMDAKHSVIDCCLISEGSVNSTNISVRKVLDVAINCNAVSVVLAHNHPGGLPIPSVEDRATTRHLAKALYMADIVLTDHIVVADKDYISMYLSNMYDPKSIMYDD